MACGVERERSSKTCILSNLVVSRLLREMNFGIQRYTTNGNTLTVTYVTCLATKTYVRSGLFIDMWSQCIGIAMNA